MSLDAMDTAEWSSFHKPPPPPAAEVEGTMNLDDELIAQIQCKLAQGAVVTKEELVGLQHHHRSASVPSLNRVFLDRWNHAPELSSFRLVRHIGMVQDMMDPEYYPESVHGQSMHFRDAMIMTEDSMEPELPMHNLSERQPLVVVPVPFASEWFDHTGRDDDAAQQQPQAVPSVVIPESPPEAASSSCRKRDRDAATDNTMSSPSTSKVKTTTAKSPMMECEEPSSSYLITSTPTSPLEFAVHGQESDWWPAGSMESNVKECPVLAKLYYDQYPRCNDKLRLNDLVELIGIVSMDPWEATFSDTTFDMSVPLPPPSRLPRMHVLAFTRLDLDEAAAVATTTTTSQRQDHPYYHHEEQPSLTLESSSPSAAAYHQNPLEAWTRHAMSIHSSTLSETLFLTLLGKAERKRGGGADGRRGDVQRGVVDALGCASLQLTCRDKQASQRLYQDLLHFLQQLCPVVAGIDLEQTQYAMAGPSKESGRLLPNPWQLPPGSTILIRAPSDWKQTPTFTRRVVHELCEQHRLTFRFEGGMEVPFDADYRIVVVSTTGLVEPLPCTINMAVSMDNPEMALFPLDVQTLHQLRQALTMGRSRTGNVHLPPSVLEQAQHDFLHRRGHARKQQGQVKLPDEADFHRWLTLTRLYARARGAAAATTVDWESALGLDDAIRVLQS